MSPVRTGRIDFILACDGNAAAATAARPALVPMLLGALAAAACDAGTQSPDDGTPDFAVRDSAGIEIVENHAPERRTGRFWTIDQEPEFVLGGKAAVAAEAGDSSHLVWRVTGLARLVDGRVAVLSGGSDQLLLFEPSGALSRIIGRRGMGPGEFERASRLQYLPPDTLAVWQSWMGPASYFDTTGVLLKTRPIDLGRVVQQGTGAHAESWMHPLPDGSFILEVDKRGPDHAHPPGELRRPPVEFIRFDHAYATQSFGVWDGLESWHSPAHQEIGAFPTFVRSARFTARARFPWVYIADGAGNEIRQYELDGTLRRIIRRTTAPPAVTEAAHGALLKLLHGWLADGDVDSSRGLFGDMPKPDRHPSIGPMVVDAEGYLWVREWSDRGTGLPDQWSVFNADGRWLGVVPGQPDLFLCSRLMPFGVCWFGRDHFLTVRRDGDGVERIEGYRIRREEGR